MQCIKCIFLLLTSLFLTIGLLPVIFIIWFVVVKTNGSEGITGSQDVDISISCLVAAMVITPFFGIIGVALKKSCWMYMFASLLILFILIKIALLTMLVDYGDAVETFVDDKYDEFHDVVKVEIQTQLSCCNETNSTSILQSNHTACIDTDGKVKSPCPKLIYEKLDEYKAYIAGGFGGLALIEVIMISLAYILKQDYHRNRKPNRKITSVHPLASYQTRSDHIKGLRDISLDEPEPPQVKRSSARRWAKQANRESKL